MKRNETDQLAAFFFTKKMMKDVLNGQILSNFGHSPTSDQLEVVSAFSEFVFSSDAASLFLLRGFAGTGKTSLVSALVQTLRQLERSCVLMAPTGRAAKVFSAYACHEAFTIHKRIYRQQSLEQNAAFTLGFNALHHAFFFVDEASMVSRDGGLLDDLIQFVYGNGRGCRLVLVGDTAQLPPVGEDDSPALSPDVLRGYGMTVHAATLTQVVRQQEESGILWNATRLRHLLSRTVGVAGFAPTWRDGCKIRFYGFADVVNVPGSELIETLSDCYHRFGIDETIVVCRSNKRAVAYNNGIRNQILGREDELCQGDQLMIAKNNYHVLLHIEEGMEEGASFLANGDIAMVERVRNVRELYGFRFADCTLCMPDYSDLEFDATVLLDTLHAEAPALPRDRQEQLYQAVLEDYQDLPNKRERLKKLREDSYFNALQVKYAYAVTCHKAQGGQWSHVFIDQGYMTEEMLDRDYVRWLYTALTRATATVYFVNWREQQTLLPD